MQAQMQTDKWLLKADNWWWCEDYQQLLESLSFMQNWECLFRHPCYNIILFCIMICDTEILNDCSSIKAWKMYLSMYISPLNYTVHLSSGQKLAIRVKQIPMQARGIPFMSSLPVLRNSYRTRFHGRKFTKRFIFCLIESYGMRSDNLYLGMGILIRSDTICFDVCNKYCDSWTCMLCTDHYDFLCVITTSSASDHWCQCMLIAISWHSPFLGFPGVCLLARSIFSNG